MKNKVITPVDIKPKPSILEQEVALLMVKHFSSNVTFVKRGAATTPDIMIGKTFWEIKHIRGNSKHTIGNNLRTAQNQSPNIIVSLKKTKMTLKEARGRVKKFLTDGATPIKQVLIISKNNSVLEIKK